MHITIPRRIVVGLAGALVTLVAGATPPPAPASNAAMQGFTVAGTTAEQQLEARFDALLDPAEMRAWLQHLSAEPNHVGAPHDKTNAEWLAAHFRDWGWQARIERFEVLNPEPVRELVELVVPTQFKASLREPALAGDSTSALPGALPPYNIYGADGDVTGDLVYANYGMPEDYAELARLGVSVKGKIVITRYGGGWRGLKPELAYQHGAIGCLIYSDPRNDGYFGGVAWPTGPTRPDVGVQRGSVMKMQLHPGDPTTPGWGSVPGAKHLAIKDATTILKIPVLPISYADATPLLKAMGGPVAPEAWRGALPFTYHVAGAARVHLVVKSNWTRQPLYDVIATLPGRTPDAQWVLRGNHHDGWVFGAFDPLAGTVAMLAEAKAMGALYEGGWRPARSIVYASWDGEEEGLLGSTEWAETHADELRAKTVLYVNSDTNGRGFLDAGGSHSLQHLVNAVAAGVIDPETHVSVQRRLRARLAVAAAAPGASARLKAMAKEAAKGGDIPISPLGSGSDYSAFLQHLGIATLDLGFGGEAPQGGVYHSRYDSFDHFIRYGDPKFEYGVALAKVAGHIVLRTANAELLPMRFDDVAATLAKYVKDLHDQVDAARKAATAQHALLDAGDYRLAADPLHPVAPPSRLTDVPTVSLAPLDAAVKRLQASAAAWQKAYAAQAAAGLAMEPATTRAVNQLMGNLEQRFLSDAGLPRRAWYRNLIQAPGELTGYAPKTIPAVHEALDARDWSRAAHYAKVTAGVIDAYRAQLEKLTARLQR